jgi:hypothetical protein
MKLPLLRPTSGFTIAEMTVATAIGSLMMAALITASVSLQKSLNAVDNYFDTGVQQIRVVDFLSRDVKRSYIVNTANYQTVTCTVPNYLIQSGDSDATSSNIGTRRLPRIYNDANGITANYSARQVSNVKETSGSATLTVVWPARFTSTDAGQQVVGDGIPVGTSIQSVSNCVPLYGCSQATMSSSATATSNGATIRVGSVTTVRYAVSNQTIQRTENGSSTPTAIAGSSDNLIPSTSDIELTNTEYTQSTITFLPVFRTNSNDPNSIADKNSRTGTTIFSLSYLRNKRRTY